MKQKVILVTGASSGIGKETAMVLAQQGHTVIIHGRNEEKTRRVFEEIKSATSNKNLDFITVDLSLLAEIEKMADKLKEKYDQIDVLINNAGGQFGKEREMTTEGHERTMAINVFAPYLLTKLLLPALQKGGEGRVVTVSSASYTIGKFDATDIELKRDYSLTRSYGLSKRYAYWVMLKYTQSNIKNVTFNTVEPGSADSDLGRVSREGKLANLVYYLWKPMMWSIEKAAETSIYLAVSKEVDGVNGQFFGNKKKKKIKGKYRKQEEMDILWRYLEKECESRV